MILPLVILLSTSCTGIPGELNDLSEFSEFFAPPSSSILELEENAQAIFHHLSKETAYVSAGAALGSISLVARLGWEISRFSPVNLGIGHECLLLSQVCGEAARLAFRQVLKKASVPSQFLKQVPPSQHSWYLNHNLLSKIPAFSNEQKQLLLFLERRWLAKSAGFYSSMIDWVCPCFGIKVQVHPETTNTYARDPVNKLPKNYENIVEDWKLSLPHPHHFPLILTRPFDIRNYLSSYFTVPQDEGVKATVERLALTMLKENAKILVDLTHIFPENLQDRELWLQTWQMYQTQFSHACNLLNIDLKQILFIQRLKQDEIGGIRLLPLSTASEKEIDNEHRSLLEWISKFGLSANRVELDRWSLSSPLSAREHNIIPLSIEPESKEAFVSYLNNFDQSWTSNHPQKTLMIKGTMLVLKGLLADLSEDKWKEMISCPTRALVVQLSFSRIKKQLNLLAQEEHLCPFFETASRLEEVHASLSALLEIFHPFSAADFQTTYQELLKSIPTNLHSMTTCGIHSSGMTSLGGVLKAVERSQGRPPHILYGENTYFESILAANLVSKSSPADEASETEWEDVDLLLGQFNPVLKRIDSQVTEYRVEKVEENLRKALNSRKGKPLTLALDCTLDFIDSPRVSKLLAEFQDEIEKGFLNIICYRSGLKFDLFGMDNYCGAPFYMIHNHDSKWDSFNSLSTDPALQTDRLSLNWFCLAYRYAATELKLYQKQIFANTRDLLNKVPSKLLKKNINYRVIPVDQDADPSFIDIKITGPFHQIKGSTIVGGIFSLSSMEKGHPIFYRQSMGFYHSNFSILFCDECTTIRLTLGLDPSHIDILAKCFEKIEALNDSSSFFKKFPH